MQSLLTSLLLITAGGIHAVEPESLSYETPVTIAGTIVREFDMSFVDSDLSPLQNPREVARAVAEARRRGPVQDSKQREPHAHFILRLEKPVSIRAESPDKFHPEERNVSEIDLGGSVQGITEMDFGKTRYVVSGTLSPAMTVHHLRPITMKVTTLKRPR
ncbi:MAG: hypothetical protein EOP84_12725 [Verrucomicrobiaceae bacterium]|nr:MAG: hypothetical protein EOP84_12725 [Verrucomicrobiaceae bacterium]